MKFSSRLRKGNKDNLSVSDPGSEDSWALLYQKNEESHAEGPASDRLKESVSNVVTKDGNKKELDTKVVPLLCDGAPQSSTGNGKLNNTNPGNLTSLPYTSTPFISHKKIPSFEVSCIISPIDEICPEGLQDDDLPYADTEKTLVVNRRNPTRPEDETFDKLVDPGRKTSKSTNATPCGIKRLGSYLNKADTTRQYAGAVVNNNRNTAINLSESERSWQTIEGNMGTMSIASKLFRSCKGPKSKQLEDLKSVTANSVGSKACSSTSQEPHFGKQKKLQNDENIPLSKDINAELGKSSPSGSKDGVVSQNKQENSENICLKANLISSSERNLFEKPASVESSKLVMESLKEQDCINSEYGLVETVSVSSSLGPNRTEPPQSNRKFSLPSELLSSRGPERSCNESTTSLGQQQACASVDNSINAKCTAEDNKKNFEGHGEQVTDIPKKDSLDDKDIHPSSAIKQLQGANDMNKVESIDNVNTSLKVVQKHAQVAAPSPQQQSSGNIMVCFNSNFVMSVGNHCIKQSNQYAVAFNQSKKETCSTHVSSTKSNVQLKTKVKDLKQHCHSYATNPPPTNTESKVVEIMEHRSDSDQHALKMKETISTTRKNNDAEINNKVTGSEVLKPNNNVVRCDAETDSSSEEERKLLRAQSLKLRMNKSSSPNSRNKRSPKGLGRRSQKINFQNAVTSEAPIESPISTPSRQLMASKQAANHQEESECGKPEEICDEFQNQKAFDEAAEESLNSSCDIVLLSRNPPDYRELSEDDFQLEIVSSSEEEGYWNVKKKAEKKTSETSIPRKQHAVEMNTFKKGRNLSFKTIERRRRRKEKLEEMLESTRDSSDSASKLSHSDAKQHEKKNLTRKKKTVDLESLNEIGNNFRQTLDGVPTKTASVMPESPTRNPQVMLEQINLNSYNGLAEKGNAKFSPRKKQVRLPSKPKMEVSKDAMRNQDSIEKLIPEKISSSSRMMPELTSRGGANSSHFSKSSPVKKNVSNDTQKRTLVGKDKTLKRTVRTDPDLGFNEVPRKVLKGDVNEPASTERGNTAMYPPDRNELNEMDDRYPKRSRKPPSKYWVMRRAVGKYSDNDHHKSLLVTLSNREKADHEPERKVVKRQSKGINKIFMKVKDRMVNTVNSSTHAGKGEALIYEETGQDVNDSGGCTTNEVKESKCVQGCGVSGDVLVLGAGAKYSERKSTLPCKVFYILEGRINYQCGHQDKILSTGSFFIIPKGEDYTLSNASNSVVKLVVISRKA